MSEKKNIGHRVSFGALSIFLNNFPAKPHHNKSTFGCNFHEWTWFSLPPFEGFCVWRRNVQGRKEWPDSRCTTPSMKHSCGKANGYERHCRLDEYARMHTKFCQLWYPSLALKNEKQSSMNYLTKSKLCVHVEGFGPSCRWAASMLPGGEDFVHSLAVSSFGLDVWTTCESVAQLTASHRQTKQSFAEQTALLKLLDDKAYVHNPTTFHHTTTNERTGIRSESFSLAHCFTLDGLRGRSIAGYTKMW